MTEAASVGRVVVIVQENHTTDNYFRPLRRYGANVATGWPTTPNPPADDPPHHRHAYFRWLTRGQAEHVQFAARTHLRFYLHLALTGALLENHCSSFGTNSTPNHLVLIGGQSPTLRNPGRPGPVWDLPSVFGLAEDAALAWRAYTGEERYPVRFYEQLRESSNVVPSGRFVSDAEAADLPPLIYLWPTAELSEHPPRDVNVGMHHVWRAVDAVVRAGGWDDTVFLLTYDDWGGYDDHVRPPAIEYTPDNVQLALGPRVPLIVFGGRITHRIDNRWCSHASVARTAIQLLGLPPLGVARVDDDPGLADLVSETPSTSAPPRFGQAIRLPSPPPREPRPQPLPPPPGPPLPVPPVLLRDGSTLPPPDDVPLPRQPRPPRIG
jgi:Phosphoesterase family